MRLSGVLTVAMVGACCLTFAAASAKDSRPAVPAYVLAAHTVAVVIDPDAGISADDPNGNQIARDDVEKALLNWGRFMTTLATRQADLVIVLRKGHGRVAEETLSDPRQNNRPGSIQPTQNGVSIGAQHGAQPGSADEIPDASQSGSGSAHAQLEVGRVDDSFEVYEGGVDHPLQGVPGWRWVRKDGLHPHDVPAVAEFRKAIAAAEKQAGKKP